MALLLIVGKPSETTPNFVRSEPTGAETLDASIPAGSVGLAIQGDVRLDSIEIDAIAKELAQTLRDHNYSV